MILTVKPKKFELYHNTDKKTAAQVRASTGADIVINCWLYDMKTFEACCDVKVKGVVLHDDQYKYWGYGFNKNDTRMTMSDQMNKWENYFSCVGMLKDGKKIDMYYDKNVGRNTSRSAVGFKADGTMVIYCTKSSISIPSVQKTMLNEGCVDAVNMDGGASVQIASDYGSITSYRRVHGYLCIWIEKDKTCPYKEPTINIRLNSRGEGAKWTQWHLNQHGAKLTVDGIFGVKSVTELKAFQKKANLVADGICGKATRTALKNI